MAGTYPNNEAGTVIVPDSWKKPVDFVARVGGDSMKNYVDDGQYAAFTYSKDHTAKHGEPVAVLIGDQIVLKVYEIRKGKPWLVSTNPKVKPFEFDDETMQILALCHGLFPHPTHQPKKKR